MKVLIFSVTAGQGHNQTGKAIADYLTSQGVKSEVFDTYHIVNGFLATFIDKGYAISTKNLSILYANVYKMWENRKGEKNYDKNSMMRIIHTMLLKKLENMIESYEPDAIVCTHVLPNIFMDILKKRDKLNVPVYGILTDFVFHPYWEESRGIDYIVTATELLNLQALKKGFKRSQVLPFGIPINPKFAKHENKQKMRRQLGFDQNLFTILLMGGSMGYGNMAETLKKIDALNIECQIISVCGNNNKAKETIDHLITKKRIYNYGFVNNVDQLMDASDCIITKPGGLTTSEALAKNLPMIIVNPIPGQEERNREFLLNNGVAMAVTETCPLDEVIFQFFFFPEKIENMKKNIGLMRRPNSTRDICEYIIEEINNKK